MVGGGGGVNAHLKYIGKHMQLLRVRIGNTTCVEMVIKPQHQVL